MEIENEVKVFTARSSRQPTDEQFLELENTIRELRAKYCRDQSVCNDGGSVASSSGSQGKETTRGSNASSRMEVSEHNVQRVGTQIEIGKKVVINADTAAVVRVAELSERAAGSVAVVISEETLMRPAR